MVNVGGGDVPNWSLARSSMLHAIWKKTPELAERAAFSFQLLPELLRFCWNTFLVKAKIILKKLPSSCMMRSMQPIRNKRMSIISRLSLSLHFFFYVSIMKNRTSKFLINTRECDLKNTKAVRWEHNGFLFFHKSSVFRIFCQIFSTARQNFL